jgi:hypothetical protein
MESGLYAGLKPSNRAWRRGKRPCLFSSWPRTKPLQPIPCRFRALAECSPQQSPRRSASAGRASIGSGNRAFDIASRRTARASGQRHRASSHYASKWVVIIGRAPGCAARFASSKAARRCSGSSLSICPLAISKLETPYSPHFGQAMLTPSIVTSVSSALAPQTRQFICCSAGWRLGPEPSPSWEAVNSRGMQISPRATASNQDTRPLGQRQDAARHLPHA